MIKLNSLLAREFVAIQPNPRDVKSLANYIRIKIILEFSTQI
jgi:hypothetical protein